MHAASASHPLSPKSSASSTAAAAPSGFFALRTPLLPHDVLSRLSADLRAPRALAEGGDVERALEEDRAAVNGRLRELVQDPVIREALFVASPSLDDAIEAWLADRAHPRARGVAEILVRYLGRMASRPTPFGLFSGCSVGKLAAESRLALAPRDAYRSHTRLDMHYLSALCEALDREPALRAALPVRPSNGLYPLSDAQLRYAEGRNDPKTRERTYHLVAVERTDYLDATLERARRGARRGELAQHLVERDAEIKLEEAEAYVDSLIDAQILVSDLAPVITGPEPVRDVLATLGAHPEGGAAARTLQGADDAIRAIDAESLGRAPARYRAIAEGLASLPTEAELARLFQVDLYKPVADARLGAAPLREIERAISVLVRMSPAGENESLKRFREAFSERYGERSEGPLSERRAVPLAEVLDEEAGIGFDSGLGYSAEPSPLLEGLAFPPDPSPPSAPNGAREAYILRGLTRTLAEGKTEWALSDADVDALAAKKPVPLPGAFAVMAVLAAASAEKLDAGDFRLLVQAVSGPSGAILLGRFCHGDPALRRAVEEHLAAEEAARPDAIFAEIVHLSEGRLGNILCRPALRTHEITYLGRSGVADEMQIPIADLRVTVADGRVVLLSAKHGREVLPRLTSAHNYAAASLGIYRFLCTLQHSREWRGGLGWSWGALSSAPFVPRVSYGRVVLALARWTVGKADLAALGKASGAERYRAVQALRERIKLPRWVALEDRDNILPVDLDNVLHVESLVQLVKGREGATFVETFEGEGDLAVEGPEGRFTHEIVVPFVRKKEVEPRPALEAGERKGAPAAIVRSFPPGSEWLYAKLYTGTATADAVLKRVIAPVVEDARASGAARSWFFIRFSDPHWHVRVRFRGEPSALLSHVLPKLREAAAPFQHDGRIWKTQLDTYEREVERYGGAEGIELAEALFEADSDSTLRILALLEDEDASDVRWRLTLRGMHAILTDLGLDLAQRTQVLQWARASFGAEHRVDVHFEKGLGAKFRAERAALDALMAARPGEGHPFDPGPAVLAERSERGAETAKELLTREKAGRLTIPIVEVAGSYLHMHANRLLRSEQRAQELVLYDFLLRLYESEAARAKKRV